MNSITESGPRRPEDELKLKETFHKKEKHILRSGDRLSLKCIATGSPLPTITWSLDGAPIPETHRIQYGDYVRYVKSCLNVHSMSELIRDLFVPPTLLIEEPLCVIQNICPGNDVLPSVE